METLTLIKLRDLITNQIQESLHLEYKSCAVLNNSNRDELLNDLTKQVTAFANADGGTLIFGIKEGQGRDKKHLPESLDEGFTRGGKVSAIWLEDILLSNISPKIQGLKPYEIELENGHFLLVLEVPQSQYGPHMAKDHKYYKRRQTKAEPMEHYEVEDVRNRSRGPLLRLNVEHFQTDQKGNNFVTLELENLTDQPAQYVQVYLYFDDRLNFSGDNSFQLDKRKIEVKSLVDNFESLFSENKQIFSHLDNVREPISNLYFNRYTCKFGLPENPPIWKENPIRLKDFILSTPKKSGLNTFLYGWQISSPYMPVQKQFHLFDIDVCLWVDGRCEYTLIANYELSTK